MMDQSPASTSDLRLDRLERENRHLRRGLLATWLALAAAVVVGTAILVALRFAPRLAGKPRVVEAERFVLRHLDGSVRMMMFTTDEGNPYFYLYDNYERRRICLSIQPDNAARISMLGEDEHDRITIDSHFAGQTSGIGFHDRKGVTAIGLGIDTEGRPAVSFRGEGQVLRFKMGLTRDGVPGMIYWSKDKGRWIKLIAEPSEQDEIGKNHGE